MIDWNCKLAGDAVAWQLVVLQAAIASASMRLEELHVEGLDVKFFSSKAADIGKIWKSLTVLRLEIVQHDNAHGAQDLGCALRELTNLKQLYLANTGACLTRLDSLVEKQETAWSRLTQLTLQRFVVSAPTLQRLLSIPSIVRTSLCNIILDGDDCWIRIMTRLREKRWEHVHLSGWLVNIEMDDGWAGDSDKDGSLFRQVTEWLMEERVAVGNMRDCPLTIDNMNVWQRAL
ncbi:hypothetical protein HBI23_257660 [Parastagonospora nodorum]|nr:hypothetical protein HBI23_257660 [Parastagonospora nodorum]KAH5619277.1 hypothetical protein HBI51_252700 [Parastagonospora nodorum]KAH5982772.1 hypothetical protein HBI84_250350 [Parastagonospora nodorum]KAH6133541.1 hypothetical protein HBI68_251780 [Parastagonospora nodorum]KAH6380491.1 hypothetical protein HBI08_237400 [Parastagonospora nodorum]